MDISDIFHRTEATNHMSHEGIILITELRSCREEDFLIHPFVQVILLITNGLNFNLLF